MITENHIDREDLEMLLSGNLSSTQQQVILTHLSTCEQCLHLSEQSFDKLEAIPWAAPIDIPAATPPRVKRQLFNQLHRSDLSGQIVRFGTAGLVHVILSVLRILPGSPS